MRKFVKALAFISLSTAAALPVPAADHREAPRINETPPADINDIYAFTAPNDPERLVLVMTVNPLSDRDFAGSYAFSPRVRYRFGIDTDGDARFERNITLIFSEQTAPGVQTFRARFPGGIVVKGDVTPPSTPDEPVLVEDPSNGIVIFAGPRDDPFFFDAVGFNRVRAGDLEGFRNGDDSFAGFNVSAIVIEAPVDLVSGGSPVIGLSGLTRGRTARSFGAGDRRLDRMGVAGVSTAFVPFDLKDEFNQTLPRHDAAFADAIVAALQGFGTPPANIDLLASIAIPDLVRLDLTRSDGFPNGRRLEDDVIDVLLGLIFDFPGGPTTDKVNRNDKKFLGEMPYLAAPFQPE